jgi:HAD superfamily hydrolase (TIGR01509 family)
VYDTIIFDFFGVLSKSDPYANWLTSHGYKREGRFAQASHDVDVGNITVSEFYSRLSGLSGETVESIKKVIEDISIDDSVLSVVKQLSGSYKLGLLSNAPSELLRPLLEKHGLAALFDAIVISSDVRQRKPNPEVFAMILKKLESRPQETLFIDDLQDYVDGAKQNGITGLLYESTPKLIDDLNKIGVKEVV